MQKESRYRQAVRAVWERSDQQYLGWPEERREAELYVRYWEVGDPPGVLLGQHLPGGWGAEERLTLEEACFWRRLLAIRHGG